MRVRAFDFHVDVADGRTKCKTIRQAHFAIALGQRNSVPAIPAGAGLGGSRDGSLSDEQCRVGFRSYDPYGDSADKTASIEFLPWEDVDLATLPLADAYALQRNRSLLITIEPWTWSEGLAHHPERTARRHIERQVRRANMQHLQPGGTMKSPVTIRWAQEMEDKNGRFT